MATGFDPPGSFDRSSFPTNRLPTSTLRFARVSRKERACLSAGTRPGFPLGLALGLGREISGSHDLRHRGIIFGIPAR